MPLGAYKNKEYLVIALLTVIIVAVVSFVPIGGENADNVLRALFSQYIAGKSVGLLKFSVTPRLHRKVYTEGFYVIVHNFTDYMKKGHSEIVHMGDDLSFSIVTLRIPRFGGGYVGREYSVSVVNPKLGLYGSVLVRVEPEKPVTNVPVVIHLHKHRQLSRSGGKIRTAELEEVRYTNEVLPAIQLHSTDGLETKAVFRIGNILYYSQKYRSYWWWENPEDEEWVTTGDKATQCINSVETPYLASSGSAVWVEVTVNWRYERWFYAADEWSFYEEYVTPVSFGGWDAGELINCAICGGEPSGSHVSYSRGTSTIEISLGPGVHEVERWGLKVHFQVSYGPITVYVELWKAVESGSAGYPPSIKVYVYWWRADKLYAFDGGTQWKVVHFTWQSP